MGVGNCHRKTQVLRDRNGSRSGRVNPNSNPIVDPDSGYITGRGGYQSNRQKSPVILQVIMVAGNDWRTAGRSSNIRCKSTQFGMKSPISGHATTWA
ncbi:hypothetical protein CUMW_222600 [Citrus unshiu]|uniref:Uncharacterized protein n=1 Tax=Citrus unshiu TaxID=55188 RepID=A0A2H5QEN8_CITUN|nr:hypothetical protein CUMW_222600 [Citrus unshiu]